MSTSNIRCLGKILVVTILNKEPKRTDVLKTLGQVEMYLVLPLKSHNRFDLPISYTEREPHLGLYHLYHPSLSNLGSFQGSTGESLGPNHRIESRIVKFYLLV